VTNIPLFPNQGSIFLNMKITPLFISLRYSVFLEKEFFFSLALRQAQDRQRSPRFAKKNIFKSIQSLSLSFFAILCVLGERISLIFIYQDEVI